MSEDRKQIKPIYFPFTYVPKWVAQALAACFQRFIVYQPSGNKVPDEMRPWVEANVMEVRVPAQTDDQALEKVVKDFRSFASLHDDSKSLKTAALLGQQYAIPFISETSVSQIVADIKKGGSTDPMKAGSDPLLRAKVFLGFAQDFDRQCDELNQELGVHDQRSCALLKTLKGENEIESAAILLAAGSKLDDPAEYMTLSRLLAWSLLFQKDAFGSGLFVTSSRSVFNALIAKQPATEKIIHSSGLPAVEIEDKAFNSWRDHFLKHLHQLVEIHGSASKDIGVDFPLKSSGAKKVTAKKVTLTLYRVPGQIPWDLFAQYFEAQHPSKNQLNQMVKFKNTLIGLIECQR